MNTEQPAIVTVPTELSRTDGWFDLSALMISGLAVWWLALKGVPVWAFIPGLILLAIFTLSGEPASDIPFVGAIAAGLRSKLGLRRAHEWVMAWWHYFLVRQWPDFQEWARARSQRMYVAVRRVRWIRWCMDGAVSRMQKANDRLRLPLWVPRRLRGRVASVPRV